MAGSTNFQQWNPSQNNQETDAGYTSDSQRVGGAPVDTAFPSATANKLFYQTTTGVTALMLMLAAKGFVVNDTNIGTLASVLSALLTTADVRPNLQVISWSSTVTCNASAFLGFQINLAGNTTIILNGGSAGDEVTFILTQDSTGSRTITWPGTFQNPPQPDPTPSSTSVLSFKKNSAGNWLNQNPAMSSLGTMAAGALERTPIGVTTPSTGRFTTPSATDNSLNAATTAWAQLGLNVVFGNPGHIRFPTWMGGGMIQWGHVTTDINGGSLGVSFSPAFTTQVDAVLPVTLSSTDRITFVVSGSVSLGGFTISNNGSSGFAYWVALGK